MTRPTAPRTTTVFVADRSEARRSRGRRPVQIPGPAALLGFGIIGVFLLAAVLQPFLGLPDPLRQDLASALQGPSAEHLLGTDQLGRDLLSRIIHGARYSLLLGLSAVLIGAAIGIPLGAASGYFGGKFDLILQRFVDILMCFPNILLALLLIAAFGSGEANVAFAVGLASVPSFVRLTRGAAMQTRSREFVEAARSLQVGHLRILATHIIPHALPVAVVNASVHIGAAIIEVAGLGFLGVGIQAPTPEWGTMLAEARNTIYQAPLQTIIPGLCIALSVLAFNLIGDYVRARLEPNSAGKLGL